METPIPPPGVVGRLMAAQAVRALADEVAGAGKVLVPGLWGSSVALAVAGVVRRLNCAALVVCGHLDEADDIADDIELFLGRRPEVLPALELAGSLGRASEELVANRLQLISRLAIGWGDVESAVGKVVVAPVAALMQSVPSKAQLAELTRELRAGSKLEVEKLIVWLTEHGYQRLEQVEVPGDFAVRGGIVDVYLPGEHSESGHELGLPVRIDFFDDEIESIKRFSLETLGSLSPLQKVALLDIRGKLPESSESVSLLSYLPPDGVVAAWAPLEIQEQARSYLERVSDAAGLYPLGALLRQMEKHRRLEMTPFKGQAALVAPGAREMPLPVGSMQRFETENKRAIAEFAELARSHDITVFCDNDGERQRLTELLEQHHKGLSHEVELAVGYLHRGFVFEPTEPPGQRGIGALGHHELFNRYEVRRRVKKAIASRPVDSFLDLKVGDYVVHVAHGIAKFTGIQTLTREGRTAEYLTLRFAEEAVLHVPATRVNLIQKYVGGFSGHPTLSRLGSGVWEKQKAKVQEAVLDLAAEMIEVQAARAAEPGVAFPPDTLWQKEFEAEFPYEPTADQLTASDEIKLDMGRPRPMDRLLCGDVGYGKTELAMRAAFKAVEYGKQVAVLVPTTVLAEQHERSFRERMKSYPFTVEGVSRFKSSREVKETLDRLKRGETDVLIGTHRLLSKDVGFHDLGLVIVDEEQRFGVQHKESLKRMRKTVDVLTMSATPIPRTLSMSLLGLRDISSLTTAPQDRRSVVTEVMEYDANRVKAALQRELAREGQVYFVHNRVKSIHDTAALVKSLVPEARILVGHGQMDDEQLEEIMLRFVRHEADILVCTTIIESGLDIPNANTIIIDNADRFGLSELHQLRGRVGRYKHRAYCYLLLPEDRVVTEIAAKRLKAIEEYSHLGSGFKIAMRDLELRGAGNILGPEQSGHIAAVGYEMYCQLLDEATRQVKNEAKPVTPEAHVEIGVTEMIPKAYIPGDRQRLDLYRRLSRCTSIEMLGQLRQDTVDAHGEAPRQVDVLVAMTELKLLATHFGIARIVREEPDIVLTVREAGKVQAGLVGAPGTIRVIDEKTIYLRMPPVFMQPETALIALRNLLKSAWDRENGTGTDVVGANVAGTDEVATQAAELQAEARPPTTLPRRLDPAVLLPKQGPKSAGAKRIEQAAKQTAPAAPPKGPTPHPDVRPSDLTAADRSRMAVASKTQSGAAHVKAAAEGKVPAQQPKSVGGTESNSDYDKLLSLREMGILTDAEFAVALKRLLEKQGGGKKS
jgi:transcription-repair coupling factor (superfamily II helicase)